MIHLYEFIYELSLRFECDYSVAIILNLPLFSIRASTGCWIVYDREKTWSPPLPAIMSQSVDGTARAREFINQIVKENGFVRESNLWDNVPRSETRGRGSSSYQRQENRQLRAYVRDPQKNQSAIDPQLMLTSPVWQRIFNKQCSIRLWTPPERGRQQIPQGTRNWTNTVCVL